MKSQKIKLTGQVYEPCGLLTIKLFEMKIEITKEVNEHLRQTWYFNIFDFDVVFVGYVVEEKPPKKRKWMIAGKWDKYGRRYENTIKEEPKLKEHIKRDVLEKAQSMIKVMTWDEWKS